jgi:hypothetical protein
MNRLPQQDTSTPSWFAPTAEVFDRILYLCFSEKEFEHDHFASDEEEKSIIQYQDTSPKTIWSPPRPFQSKPVHFQTDMKSLFQFEDDESVKSAGTETTVSMNSWSWDSVDSDMDSVDSDVRSCGSSPSRPAVMALTKRTPLKCHSTHPDLAEPQLIRRVHMQSDVAYTAWAKRVP